MTRFLIDEKTIIERADRRARKWESWRYLAGWFALILFVAGVGFWPSVHAWLRLHREFLWGVLAGSLLQAPGWLRDRWLWLKWFSHQ